MTLYAIRFDRDGNVGKLVNDLPKIFGFEVYGFVGEDDAIIVPSERDGKSIDELELRKYLDSVFGDDGYRIIDINKQLNNEEPELSAHQNQRD